MIDEKRLAMALDVLGELQTVLEDSLMERAGGKKPPMADGADDAECGPEMGAPEPKGDDLESRLAAASSGPADENDEEDMKKPFGKR